MRILLLLQHDVQNSAGPSNAFSDWHGPAIVAPLSLRANLYSVEKANSARHTEYGVKFHCKDFGFCRVRHIPVAPLRLRIRKRSWWGLRKPRHSCSLTPGLFGGGTPWCSSA